MILFINRLLWLPRLPFILLSLIVGFGLFLFITIIIGDATMMYEWWDREEFFHDYSTWETHRVGARHLFRSFPR